MAMLQVVDQFRIDLFMVVFQNTTQASLQYVLTTF
jgi:hypothetical protein